MSPTVDYHCMGCLDHSVQRDFDVSHVSLTCESCGEFERFVNGHVLEQFRAFEASPPDDLDWERLDRMEKFLVAERIVRRGRSIEDFDVDASDDDGD